MSMRALASLDAIVPRSIRDRAPWERSLSFDPEPNPGDPPPTPPEPKRLELTQAQLDAMIQDRLKRSAAERDELKTRLDAITKAQAELQAKNDELELKGKSADEKARMAAEKAAKQIEADRTAALKERDDAKAIADAATKSLRAHVIGSQVSQALIAAKALPTSLRHATPAFLADIEIDADEHHGITAVRLGGVAQKDVATAAAEWLKSNPHFAQHTGGGGTKGGAGVGTSDGRPLHELSASELLQLDAANNRR